MPQNKAWTLASYPEGWVSEANFKLVEAPAPSPKDGEVLVKNFWLSLDPYMRGRLSQQKSYVKGVEIGEVMTGETAGEVIESKHPKFARGDKVRVIDGPFVNFQGVVDDMNPERGRMKVVVPVFGRPTSVELEYYQVERI